MERRSIFASRVNFIPVVKFVQYRKTFGQVFKELRSENIGFGIEGSQNSTISNNMVLALWFLFFRVYILMNYVKERNVC